MDEMCFEFRSDRYTRVVSTTTKRLLFRFHSFFHVFSDPLIGFELVSTLAKGKLTTSFLKKKKKRKKVTFNFSSLSSSRTNEKLEKSESQRRFIIQSFEKFEGKEKEKGGRQRKNGKTSHCFVSFDPFNQNHIPARGSRINLPETHRSTN